MTGIRGKQVGRYAGLILLAAGFITGCGSSSEQQTFHERIQSEREKAEHELHLTQRQRRHQIADKLGLSPSEAQHLEEAPEKYPEPKTQFTSAERKLAAQERVFCEVTPERDLADEYGVANTPAAIAHAIGLEYRNRVDMQIAAETGCLEGFDGR